MKVKMMIRIWLVIVVLACAALACVGGGGGGCDLDCARATEGAAAWEAQREALGLPTQQP